MSDDKEDEAAANETRSKILSLQSENSRKREWLERLREKKRALDDERKAREEDKNELELEISKEVRKQNDTRENHHADNSQDEAVGTFVEKGVRSLLGERVPAFAMDGLAEESDDEDDAGEVEAPDDGTKVMHDSVVVTYVAPNPQERDKLDEYRVTYRVDKETTGTKLHEDACEFWGCSKDEFKLCQSEKGEPREFTPQELAKNITDDTILSKLKRSHLILCHEKVLKDRKDLFSSAGMSLDIEDIIKKQTADVDDTAVTSIKGGGKPEKLANEDMFATAFSRWPGIHNLVKHGSHNQTVKNWHRIKFTDICVYFLLALFTCVAMTFRFKLEYYWLRAGVLETVGIGVAGETSGGRVVNIVGNNGLLQYNDMWDWASGSLHYQLFNEKSSLQNYYVPMGFLRVRQQKTAPIAKCLREKVTDEYMGGKCHHINTIDGQDISKLIIDASNGSDVRWINVSQSSEDSGRQDVPDPLTWTKAETSDAHVLGYMQSYYNGSGYMVDYNVTNPNTPATFLADMQIFKQVWLTQHSRVLMFEVLLANYNLGGFVSSTFMFEISPSGALKSSLHLLPISLGTGADGGVSALMLDVLRALCVFYIMTYQAVKETNSRASLGKSGLKYIFSFVGLIDASTVAIFAAMCYMRWAKNAPPNPTTLTSFYSYSAQATIHERLFNTEGLFLFLVCIRYCSFMRLTQHVEQLWLTLNRASTMMFHFMFIVAPLFFGALIFANCIWSTHVYNFSTLYETFVSLIFMIKQDHDLEDMYLRNDTWTIPFIIYYYVVMTLFCMNGFLAISVHSYFQVQLSDFSSRESRPWSRDQWMDWILPGLIYRLIFRKPPGARLIENTEGDDDGEESSDSDADEDAKDE